MRDLLATLRRPIILAAGISVGVNLLMLVSPIFMMQLFDRVLTSGHRETLFVLAAMAMVALLTLGLLDALRQMVMVRASHWMERTCGEGLIDAALQRQIRSGEAFQQIGRLRSFLASQGLFALLDAPWVILFTIFLWWMHPWLGMAALAGAVMLLAIALLAERAHRGPVNRATRHQAASRDLLESALQSRDAVSAMAMRQPLINLWQRANGDAIAQQQQAGERNGMLTGLTRFIRLAVQISVLSLGALLVLDNQLTAGGMIAASIMLGRCLAPVEQSIGAWRGLVKARSAWHYLQDISLHSATKQRTELPSPRAEVSLKETSYRPSSEQPAIIHPMSFALNPGEIVALLGPSGSGKSTLCRLLAGALEPSSGEVQLDGRAITGWNSDQVGQHVGFLPQGVELLPGTLKQNIARFSEATDAAVVEAASMAGVDELIRALPEGYESVIDPGHSHQLSMGQRQRIGLARTLFGQPKLLILDEPDAHLDASGDQALQQALRAAKGWGATIVVVTHRPNLLAIADRMAILHQGKLVRIGSREEVLKPVPMADTPSQPVPAQKTKTPSISPSWAHGGQSTLSLRS
uniref:Alkaline protease secretion ATP-binding protein aprD n=1 Tax=Magnetococcus massalia (strain MO-1) TaxID=451514 RepID=A0A1S7LFH2_MAGMO|nr:Alkaline protease secretion ATP-binding protein aprD [Candidatus Magnetococcus massalia]